MKLYYVPGACSLAPHIALREAGLPFTLDLLDRESRRTASGQDYATVNPKGYVPTLELDNGERLTEAAVILQYIADRNPGAGLAPAAGTMDHYRLLEWLNFIATELHKNFSPFFNPRLTPEWKAAQLDVLGRRFTYLSQHLASRPYLLGETFSIADAYLFTVLGWANFVKLDLGPWPVLGAYLGRIATRASVQAALKAEGLAK